VAECATEKFAKKTVGESEIEAVLQRLDRLTQEEARITVAQTLGVIHGLVGNVRKSWKVRGACSIVAYTSLKRIRQIARHQWIVFETIWVCVTREAVLTCADLGSKALFTKC